MLGRENGGTAGGLAGSGFKGPGGETGAGKGGGKGGSLWLGGPGRFCWHATYFRAQGGFSPAPRHRGWRFWAELDGAGLDSLSCPEGWWAGKGARLPWQTGGGGPHNRKSCVFEGPAPGPPVRCFSPGGWDFSSGANAGCRTPFGGGPAHRLNQFPRLGGTEGEGCRGGATLYSRALFRRGRGAIPSGLRAGLYFAGIVRWPEARIGTVFFAISEAGRGTLRRGNSGKGRAGQKKGDLL